MKYILLTFCGILLIVFSAYLISALCVSPVKEYTKNNRYYRFLLNFATDICMKVMRIRIYSSGLEKIPADCRYLLICNHRSKFDPIVTWHSTAVNFDVLEVISAEEVKKNRTNWLSDNARNRMSRKLSAETEKENGDLSHTL